MRRAGMPARRRKGDQVQTREQFLKLLLAGSVPFGAPAIAKQSGCKSPSRRDRTDEPKIDAWTHILPKAYLDRLQALPAGPLTPLVGFLSGIPALYDLEVRLKVMDTFGNYRQVLTPVPSIHVGVAAANPQLASDLVRLTNDAIAEVANRSPSRFAGFAGMLPMWDPDAAILEVNRLMGLGAAGVQIEANVNGVPLDDPRYEPFFARMAELARPIWIHPARTAAWPDYPTERTSKFGLWQALGWPYETSVCLTRLVLAGHLERHPALRIVAHHGGGMIPHFSARLGPNLSYLAQRLEPELGAALQALSKPPIEYFRMMYVDTALFGARHAVECVVEFFGADHVLFGTDSPFDPEKGPGFIRDTISDIDGLELCERGRKQIYADNLTRLLGRT
jgi:predicted TIM-barrel fold metal-dependent hydrolase